MVGDGDGDAADAPEPIIDVDDYIDGSGSGSGSGSGMAESIIEAVEAVANDIVNATQVIHFEPNLIIDLMIIFFMFQIQDAINSVLENEDEEGGEEGGDEEDDEETIHVDERFFYIEHIVRFMAVIHSLISLFMLIAYYHLKGHQQ